MTNKGNRYNDEFKADILRLIREEHQPVNKVAKGFGVNDQSIRNWLKAAEIKQDPVNSRVAELEAQLKEEKRKNADLEWYEKAIRIREIVLGKEHPDTATTYNNIAYVYLSKGEYDKALKWHEKAIKIREIVLGKEHPDTATTYNNIAYIYSRKGEYDKALEWSRKALKISEMVLGKEHTDAATAYNNIAEVYSRKGEYHKALEWCVKAVSILIKVLGFNHPNTQIVLGNTYSSYLKVGGKEDEFRQWLNNVLLFRL